MKHTKDTKVVCYQITDWTRYKPVEAIGDTKGMSNQHIEYDKHTGGYKVEIDIYTNHKGQGYEKRVYRPLNDYKELANISKRRDKAQHYHYQ